MQHTPFTARQQRTWQRLLVCCCFWPLVMTSLDGAAVRRSSVVRILVWPLSTHSWMSHTIAAASLWRHQTPRRCVHLLEANSTCVLCHACYGSSVAGSPCLMASGNTTSSTVVTK